MGRDQTLLAATYGDMGLARKAGLALAGSALIALAAQVSVPFWPVPLTLQTLAILVVGFALGSRLGAAAVLAYLAEGAMGLPVFSNGGAGVLYMMGPTGGFLVGFVGMAWIAGAAAERGLARGVVGTSLVALAASAALYLPGLAWPLAVAGLLGVEAGWAGLSLAQTWQAFAAPFLLGDVVKAVIAALVVTGAWRALRRA
ncbi:biotin transporter BioY [Roseibacterium sp. SDUM158017]|uniref:biotin transporter BioY n=1 Tax=Roseicyclus salinarum TaxID=3036773 RepID=UPI0024153BCB|nr:biotin transporter BioY [Roseibacterium sp. SDUM158017]MDG4650013.1 biotin transporter BioY [Roseibacterium sp. SDUM158017]